MHLNASAKLYSTAPFHGSTELTADALNVWLADNPAATLLPEVVRAAALRDVLDDAGLRANVEAAVSAASNKVKNAWEYEPNVRRDNPFLNAMAAQLGLTDAQVDALFIAAGKL